MLSAIALSFGMVFTKRLLAKHRKKSSTLLSIPYEVIIYILSLLINYVSNFRLLQIFIRLKHYYKIKILV